MHYFFLFLAFLVLVFQDRTPQERFEFINFEHEKNDGIASTSTTSTHGSPSQVERSQNATPQKTYIGKFKVTNYWVAQEGDRYLMDCGSSKPKKPESKAQYRKTVVLGSANGGKKYDLKGEKGSLGKVDAYTWDACYCEGTCRLRDGNTYNLLSEKNQTFVKTDSAYGLGPQGQQLVPFVSVTADKSFPKGTVLRIRELVGRRLPKNKIHDGCVRVDDDCGDGCGSRHLDLHVGTYGTYSKLGGRFQGNFNVFKNSICRNSKLNYD